MTSNAQAAPQKLRQIGLNYDIANAKGALAASENQERNKEFEREK